MGCSDGWALSWTFPVPGHGNRGPTVVYAPSLSRRHSQVIEEVSLHIVQLSSFSPFDRTLISMAEANYHTRDSNRYIFLQLRKFNDAKLFVLYSLCVSKSIPQHNLATTFSRYSPYRHTKHFLANLLSPSQSIHHRNNILP